MPEIDLLAILIAAAVAFVISSTWYALFAARLAAAGSANSAGAPPPPWKLAAELGRGLILAAVLAGVAARCGIEAWPGGLLLGFALWIGFPLVLWTGAVIWENVPPRLAVIHLGDWLVKLLAVTALVSAWR